MGALDPYRITDRLEFRLEGIERLAVAPSAEGVFS